MADTVSAHTTVWVTCASIIPALEEKMIARESD